MALCSCLGNPPYLPISARVIAQCLTDTISDAGLEGLGSPSPFRPLLPRLLSHRALTQILLSRLGDGKQQKRFSFERYVYPITKGDFTDKILA
ncbi:hypothetical protein RRG08_051454 [Elysia crispata]|uniref:Uncharacterized protein n=1 Tax=Elysia crispata TaxID=231223 RepID=A0AAE1CN78_9GAST|nr:hypothetical protein RRG08_051454 [Elysia crispata]